jgi:hypothetical protein
MCNNVSFKIVSFVFIGTITASIIINNNIENKNLFYIYIYIEV